MNHTRSFQSEVPGRAAARIILGVTSLAVAWGIASAIIEDARAGHAPRGAPSAHDAIHCHDCGGAPTFHERHPLAADAAIADTPATF